MEEVISSEPTLMVRVKHGPLLSPVSKLVPQKFLKGSELAQSQLHFARAGCDDKNATPEITLPGIDSAHLDMVRGILNFEYRYCFFSPRVTSDAVHDLQ